MTIHTASKIAISLPERTLRQVEVERRRLGRSRSSIVAEALEAWLATHSAIDADRLYLEGYRRHPELDEGVVAAAVLVTWDAWDTEPRVRAGAKTKKRSRKS